MWKLVFGAAVLLVATVENANALTVFSDRASWENAVSGTIQTDTFSNEIQRAQSITFDIGVVSTLSGNNDIDENKVDAGGFFETRIGTIDIHSNSLVWDFPQEISAFGADFSEVNITGLTISGDFDGNGVVVVESGSAFPFGTTRAGFLGFVGLSTFDRIVFSAILPSEDFRVDNLSIVTATAVPVPAALPLLAAAVSFLGFLNFRRRRIAA